MIDTILLDLDGTLLQFSQRDFISAYFSELSKMFDKLGLETESSIAAVWAGTKAMILNDGSKLNSQRFWQEFAGKLGLADERLAELEAAFNSFYVNEFNVVKSVLIPSDIPKRLVQTIASKGYRIVLATNPLFPLCAVESRLGWTGLKSQNFLHITHYANSTFSKPNPGYFREILAKVNRSPQQCLMAGNNPAEDMVAGTLGAETFLVTDCMENESGVDVSSYRSGTLADLESHLTSLPDIA